MITMQVITNYAFVHKLIDQAGLFPAKFPFDKITTTTGSELVAEYLNQDGSNFLLISTPQQLENVVLQMDGKAMAVIGTFQCTRNQAMMLKLRHHLPGVFELQIQP